MAAWSTNHTPPGHLERTMGRFDNDILENMTMNRKTVDDIVITGMSGRLPESDNIEEFAKNLFDGVDMVTADDRRWTPGLHGSPKFSAKLKNLTHFDATFFGVNVKQAHMMDPQMRLLLEATHEAIIDAGLNPAQLRGSRTGCYVGVSNSETGEMLCTDLDRISGYEITGCCQAMFANRISYSFDLKGPSYAINTGCSSSMFALAQAVAAMHAGDCDAAIVAGVNLCLNPIYTMNFLKVGMLSTEGRSAPFDANSNGYVRSEAVVVILLQRRNDARRVYATVRGARMNTDGYKLEGITYPIGDMQRMLTSETFKEARLRPQDVTYVEAHGTATKVGDQQEVNAIAEFFCKDRKTPLLLGSVKSNMGHSEPAAGLCSIVKVLIAMECGVIPGNLNYKSPNTNIPALSDGRIKVVDQNILWDGGVVAINSFGFGGANAHVILESEPKTIGRKRYLYTLPRLVLTSGRTAPAVRAMLTHAVNHASDANLHALLDAVHEQNITGHTHRGYVLLGDTLVDEIVEMDSNESRPMWFVFSGMNSQSPHTVRDLLNIPIFATSVQRSAAILRSHGVDLLHLITDASDSAFADVVNSLVFIAAIQVALIDVLRAVGIQPDAVIGYSVGELGCAYADGALTAEQTILAAYWCGKGIVEANLPPGAMATVDLSWEECEARCPSDIVLACHNSRCSVTVSGPVLSIEKFVSKLKAEGISASRVGTSSVAFHSEYIAAAAPLIQAYLEKLISNPKPRTARWISSSMTTDHWNCETARMSDAQYHVNNLLSPVRLVEMLRLVPPDVVLVEVAPHAHLQELLKHALPTPAIHIGLVCRESPDSVVHLLAALGKMYCAGAQLQVGALYPSVPWPVPRGTPGLASYVLWDHSTEWNVVDFSASKHTGGNVLKYDLSKPNDAFLAGHEIDGRILFPPAGYIVLVWKTIALIHNKNFDEMAIVIDDIQFKRETTISREIPIQFLVNIQQATGEFNVCEGDNVVVSGKVRLTKDAAAKRLCIDLPSVANESKLLPLTTDDIYKELRLRGYNYADLFCGIKSADPLITIGELNWNGNWISFLDTILQFNILGKDTRELLFPKYIQRVVIDPTAHLLAAKEANTLDVRRYKHIDLTVTRGIEFRGIEMSSALRRPYSHAHPKLEKCVFQPYINTNTNIKNTSLSGKDALTVSIQLVVENSGTFRLKILEAALDQPVEALLTPRVLQVLEVEPQVRVESTLLTSSETPVYNGEVQHLGIKIKDMYGAPPDLHYHLVLASHVIEQHLDDVLEKLAAAVIDTGMLLLEEPHGALDRPATAQFLERAGLVLVSRQIADDCDYVILKRQPALPTESLVFDIDGDTEFRWIEPLRTALKRAEVEPLRLYVVSRGAASGVLGLAKCLHTEAGGHAVRVYYLPHSSEPFTLTSPTYAYQLRNDLVVNVLHDSVWGSYRYLLLGDIIGSQLQVDHAYINTLTKGDLSSLRWIQNSLGYPNKQERPSRTELCHVYYAALNYRDVMFVTGKMSVNSLPGSVSWQEYIPGLEFSGKTSNGRRVMGVVASSGLATTVVVEKDFLWEVPQTWTLEQAATVPRAYATAYYALVVRGRLRRGETVLIHAGEAGVGQAAITIALHAGCSVFTTADTPEKRAFIRERFPQLDNAAIGNSCDVSFEHMVNQNTQGRGVDLVLNPLAGDKLLASARCLAKGGRFLEISKLNLRNKTHLGMAVSLKNVTFHCILLDALFEVDGENEDKAAVFHCMATGLAEGVVTPMPSVVFTENQLEQSFRYMAMKPVERVLICVREEETASISPRKLVPVSPRTYFHPAKSYIVVGGLGGLGLELGYWLVNRGANWLVFNSRSGISTGFQDLCIRRWRQAGVHVVVSTTDATNIDGARALLREAIALGPVGGVFNLAAVVHNAFLEKQTAASFKAVTKPKADCTKALNMATREMAPELDYFVVFSSIVSGRGSHGMTNYGYANSVMERICEQRHADGLPGLAVQWGPIGEVGLVIKVKGSDKITLDGTHPQRIASCMEVLDVLMAQPHPVVSSMVLNNTQRMNVQQQRDILQVIANIIGIKNISKISDTVTLLELGMDSLMVDEIIQILEHSYDLILDVQEVRSLTIGKLSEITIMNRGA